MARGASALVRRRSVRAGLGAAVVLVAAGSVAVANVALLHVAGSPPGEVGSLSARLPDAVLLPVTAGVTTAATVTSPVPAATAPATTTHAAPTTTGSGHDAGHDGDRDGGHSSDD